MIVLSSIPVRQVKLCELMTSYMLTHFSVNLQYFPEFSMPVHGICSCLFW